jgi:hypothetical protein
MYNNGNSSKNVTGASVVDGTLENADYADNAISGDKIDGGTISGSVTLVTPDIGTPSAGTLTNCSGTASSLTAGNVTTNANLTGVVTSSGNATAIADNAISGDKIDAGVISNFQSTGIDDRASTSNKVTLTDSGVGIGTTPNSYANRATLEVNAVWGGVFENSVSGTVKSKWDWSTGGATLFGTVVSEPLNLITDSLSRLELSAAGDVTVKTGDLIIGTAGKGIDFSAANAALAGTSSNILDDYEEGTWTPGAGTITTWTSPTWDATYTKVGRLVTIVLKQTGGTFATNTVKYMTGLPYTVSGSAVGSVANGNVQDYGNCWASGASIWFATAVATSSSMGLTVTYRV